MSGNTVRGETRARFFEGPGYFDRNTVVLMLGDGNGSYLMADGTWKTFKPGALLEGAGIEVPRRSIEAIAQAAADFLGHASHADTEARVLREALAVEQRRVDAVLGKL